MTTTPPPDSSSTSEGLLHLLPVPLKAGIQVEATVASLLPWGSPALLGLSASNAEGEPLLVIGYEWPIPWARITSPLNEDEIESLQLERFRTDYILGTKALPFVEAYPAQILVSNLMANRACEEAASALAALRRKIDAEHRSR